MENILQIDGKTIIKGIKIEDASWEDLCIYHILVDREDEIESLVELLSRCGNSEDKILIQDDIVYLLGLEDKYVFSSTKTNEFIALSDNADTFNKLCVDILCANGLKKEKCQELLPEKCQDGPSSTIIMGHKILFKINLPDVGITEYSDIVDSINESILKGYESGSFSIGLFSYDWEMENTVSSIFMVQQINEHGRLYAGFGAFSSIEDAEKEMKVGFEKLYKGFNENLIKESGTVWSYLHPDDNFKVNIREIILNRFEEI